jgi:hypothetical protein
VLGPTRLKRTALGGRTMAIHIPIRRARDDADVVEYHFGRDVYEPDPERPRRSVCILTEIGRVRVDKKSGAIAFLQSVAAQQEVYETRVVRMVRRAISNGVYPESIDYVA